MPRPKYIADLHEAHYELRVCADAEHKEKTAKYQAALTAAARVARLTEHALKDALVHDFYIWMKQESLPKPSRK